ncbi:hypothetical protein ACUX4R_25520, partial [Salmonella enterica]
MYAQLDPSLVGVTSSQYGWIIGNVQPKVERVDATRRDRLGVAALADQAEVNKNHEDNPNDETIVTPKTLANKTATETRRGLAEIATQAETNGSTDDITIVTPKKLHNRIASETLTGILAVVSKNGTAGTARSAAGTGVYNKADQSKAVTPLTLDEFTATETAKGIGYIATQAEVDGGSSDPLGPLLVTAERLGARRATESNHGLIEIATQAETNAGTDDTRAITPKKLNDRTSTETLTGIARLATTAEIDTATNDLTIVTPL